LSSIGLYIHFPFCLSKCAYCDFASAPIDASGGMPAARRYIDALDIELDLRAASAELHGAALDSVYFGGGTPTVLPTEWLAEMMSRIALRFRLTEGTERTVEANPGTVDEVKVRALLAAGVNRISLGVQSFSDDILRLLGRCHTAQDAEDAIAAARAAGCRNLNIDLIYGVPTQSVESWRDTLQRALAARPEHISAYGLSVEDGTPLAAVIESGELADLDQDLYGDMYQTARDALRGAGYVHYEISNFALSGFECRHNRKYWAADEYLGLGVSAHSYRRGVRWNNCRDAVVYANMLEAGVLPVARAERLSARAHLGEVLILGLRRAEGVSEAQIAERCGAAPGEVFAEEIRDLSQRGLLIAGNGRLRVPQEAWLVSNEVLSYFVA
jgi:oxygen-independent coproporphyrinogen-3 oxidase